MDCICCVPGDGRIVLLFFVIFWACDLPTKKESEKTGLVDPEVRYRKSYVKVPFTLSKPHSFRFTHADCGKGILDLRETDKELEYYFLIPEYASCTLIAYSKEILTFSWKDEIYCEPIDLREFHCEVKPRKE